MVRPVTSLREDDYFRVRLTPDPNRDRTWRHLSGYLSRFVAPTDTVVDIGAAYCGFINNIVAGRKIAVDIDEVVTKTAAPDVEAVVAPAVEALHGLPSDSVDVVFASNFVEHLDRAQIDDFLSAVRAVLREGGRLILLQPNYRRCAPQYFDDYTHVSVHSDRSLPDLLRARGYLVEHVDAGLMPLTVKSRLAALSSLVPLYLRLPYRPLAAQMLIVATPES